ncbi:histone-lysine N-methyltransferase 2C [Plutella xylostella]|uniref:histone-lysine N-methyltransferase 2C n=1 Tax=Plutella xylostella TaxID=51655 RepID=UPI002032B56E|nr:histone-lysine N-methyltransferase 2C [Plutella xylostella]
MRLTFWVTALAVLSVTWAKNTTSNAKPKRQLDNIRSPQNLQYSLVLPHSRVTSFRSLNNNNRRISHGPQGRSAKLPPYAVQMEPVVQYSQKDPLYDPTLENVDDDLNRNELYAQPKIISGGDQSGEGLYGPPYGSLPTAPLYSHEPQQHYYEAPEPIIEIIIKESNETLPAPPPTPIVKKKKEPVQVFYVKYSKDPHAHDKVVYDKPVPAITPPSNIEDEHEHHEEYVTVTPEPYYIQPQTTTLRAIIKPDSEVYHSESSVKVTFGNEGHGNHGHYSDRRESNGNNEDHEETAPRPAIAYPQQQIHQSQERTAQPNNHFHETVQRPPSNPGPQVYRPVQPTQHAQSRIQFQPPYLANEQQLPRQGPSIAPFRGQVARQNPFPTQLGPLSNFPGPVANFGNSIPTVAGPAPTFGPPQSRPNNGAPSFHPRPHSQPPFAPRPPNFNGPPRPTFHSGPQRPFHQPPQQPFFDEAKYLQENYHTITTEDVESPKDQQLNIPTTGFNFLPKPTPTAPQFQDKLRPQPAIPTTQLLPQQRPPQQFVDTTQNRPSFAISPGRPSFFNLKPAPPHIEENRIPFQHGPPQQQFSFHQGLQSLSRPQLPLQNTPNRFLGPLAASPSPQIIPQTQFLPQPSSPPQFNFRPQPSPAPERNQFQQTGPQFQKFNNPSERPIGQNNFHDQANLQHQQNVGQFVPNGGELVAAIPKYEQHITISGPSSQADYSGLSQQSQSSSSINQAEQQYRQQQEQIRQQEQQKNELQRQHEQKRHQEQQRHQDQQRQHEQQRQQDQQRQQHQQEQRQQEQQRYQEQNRQQEQQQHQEQQRQQYNFDIEQEQVRQQLAQNVQKQQEEIQRLQSQLLQAQQQQQQQQLQQQQDANQFELNYRQLQNNYNQQQVQSTSPKPQYNQERSRPVSYQPTYPTSTASPPYYQSTSRTVEIKPTTQKYVSSTINSINPTPESKKEAKKQKKPAFELPDEVPDDLRQQLLSSGILDNADISILDYDKVGETPLESLPPDQLANFFSAGGGQQIAASESRPIVVSPNGERIQSRIDDESEDDDQEIAASENIAQYEVPPPKKYKQSVEMKVVHFDPQTKEGQKLAKDYVKEDATRLEPVALNDKKYNRYLPLKVSGNQFPLPDILKGRKVTSVVVLAPVETELLNGDHQRTERAATTNLKGIKFIAGDSLQDLLKKPTRENYEKWLRTEKSTAADLQSVVLLVTGSNDEEDQSANKEIYMYDIASGSVNKLDGELSNAFVEAAENNALSKDFEKIAIEGEGTPESFDKSEDEIVGEGSENVPLLIDISGLSLDQENNHQVSISSGYSKTKLGRSLRKH